MSSGSQILGYSLFFNESSRGNMRRCLDNLSRYCDQLVLFDDGSTDDSYEVARSYTPHIIRAEVNDFCHETAHRQQLLELALSLDPGYIFWLDMDECLDYAGTEGGLRQLCETGKSFNFEEVTLWRSQTWRRLDYLGKNRFMRLWRNTGELEIPVVPGLHRQLFPTGLGELGTAPGIRVLHYGYATQTAIERRWRERTRLGVPVDFRRQGIDEQGMRLERVPMAWFPPGVVVPADEPMPSPIQYDAKIMREAGL